MPLYIGLFLTLIVTRWLPSVRSRGLYRCVLVLLFLFSAFRFEVGCDWTGYLNQFAVQGRGNFDTAFSQAEPLWWALIEVILRLELPYPVLNVASNAIFFWGIHLLASRQPDPLGFLVLTFPILIINIPMSGIRQGAAIGIVCIAFLAFIDRKLIRFVAFTLLAGMLHFSAVVFLLLAPLVTGKLTATRITLAIMLAIPGAFAMASGDAVQEAANRYIDTGVDAAGGSARVALFLLTSLLFYTRLQRSWRREFTADYRLVTVGALMMLTTIVLVPISSVIADRVGYYLIPLQAMILARIPHLSWGAHRPRIAFAPYMLLLVVFVIWTSVSHHFEICYVPYKTWLFGFPSISKYSF